MRKLAIFVEGQTEQIFIEELVNQIAGRHQVIIDVKKAHFGGQCPRVYWTQYTSQNTGQKYYVQIVTCCQDERVLTDIVDRYGGLVSADFDLIIGIRDLYSRESHSYSDAPIIEARSQFILNKIVRKVPVAFVVVVMEIEAWFLAEYTHFLQVHSSLTPEHIEATFGFNPKADDLEQRIHPAEDLKKIYNSVGRPYGKSWQDAQTIIQNLDFDRMYLEVEQFPTRFQTLVKALNTFISLPTTDTQLQAATAT